jgi:hypothetical protein
MPNTSCVCDPFFAVIGTGDSFGNRYKHTKQVSFDLFCQFQTCRLDTLFRVRVALDVTPAFGWLVSQTFMESLILAQDERWRRA